MFAHIFLHQIFVPAFIYRTSFVWVHQIAIIIHFNINRFLNSSFEHVRVFVQIIWFSQSISWSLKSLICLYSPHLVLSVLMSDLWSMSRCLRVWQDSPMYLKLHFVHLFKYTLFFESCIRYFWFEAA